MKGLLITACSLFLFGATYAQDNGSDDDGITNEKINLDGSPLPGHDGNHSKHWNHLTTLALSPLQYTENGVGGGISYERALDHKGIISVYVPAIATFNLKHGHSDPYNNYYYNDPYMNNRPSVMLYLMPGVKFYPTGMGKVKYAIGPNAVIGVGQKNVTDRYYMNNYYTTSSYYPGYYVPYSKMEDRLLLGMMINNSLNINATEHLYVGAEMGFGFTYYDKVGNYNEGVNFLTQGAFKIGYTF
jgi:hypothetical protein